jgi:hypothetical protein
VPHGSVQTLVLEQLQLVVLQQLLQLELQQLVQLQAQLVVLVQLLPSSSPTVATSWISNVSVSRSASSAASPAISFPPFASRCLDTPTYSS